MPLETEAKFRVDAHEPVRHRLRALGAALIDTVVETNRIYDRPDGWLRERGRGLRIRSVVGQAGDPRPATLTVKGPRIAGAFKSREELEVTVSDPETTARMLEMLGHVKILEYQKRRESWALRDARIELDQPPHVGLFVEIEAPGEDIVRAVQGDLGLDHLTHKQASYVRMLLVYCEEHGIVDRVLGLP